MSFLKAREAKAPEAGRLVAQRDPDGSLAHGSGMLESMTGTCRYDNDPVVSRMPVDNEVSVGSRRVEAGCRTGCFGHQTRHPPQRMPGKHRPALAGKYGAIAFVGIDRTIGRLLGDLHLPQRPGRRETVELPQLPRAVDADEYGFPSDRAQRIRLRREPVQNLTLHRDPWLKSVSGKASDPRPRRNDHPPGGKPLTLHVDFDTSGSRPERVHAPSRCKASAGFCRQSQLHPDTFFGIEISAAGLEIDALAAVKADEPGEPAGNIVSIETLVRNAEAVRRREGPGSEITLAVNGTGSGLFDQQEAAPFKKPPPGKLFEFVPQFMASQDERHIILSLADGLPGNPCFPVAGPSIVGRCEAIDTDAMQTARACLPQGSASHGAKADDCQIVHIHRDNPAVAGDKTHDRCCRLTRRSRRKRSGMQRSEAPNLLPMARSLEVNMKDARALHDEAIVIDGLVIANFTRAVLEEMYGAGITAANCTCSVWENFSQTMANLVRWNAIFRDNADIILQIHGAADIERAKRENKVGIILGWQNTSAIEDQIGYIELFKKLGVHVMQLTYNTQNFSGSGCYESRDSGLSDFGREVLDEMSRVGILCDLSHVGPKTTEETIRYSKTPVAFTHCCPAALKAHPRNKTDELLRLIADHDGFVGVTLYPWFLARGDDSTIDDYVDAIEYTMNLVGEDHVGFGTDFTQEQGPMFLDWLGHDKGYARQTHGYSEPVFPRGLARISEIPNLTDALLKRGWPEERVLKIIGGNWHRFLKPILRD